MKTFLVILSVIFVASCAFAENLAVRFYVQPLVQITSGRANVANWMGAQVGCSVSKRVEIGAAYQTWIPERGELPSDRTWEVPKVVHTAAYSGFVASYLMHLDRFIGVNASLLIGEGYVGVERIIPYEPGSPYREIRRDRFAVAEPSMRLMMQFTRGISIEPGIGALLTYGANLRDRYGQPVLLDRDLRSLIFTFGLRFATP